MLLEKERLKERTILKWPEYSIFPKKVYPYKADWRNNQRITTHLIKINSTKKANERIFKV